LSTELGYGFPIGDPCITDRISAWAFASESYLPSREREIRRVRSFRSCTQLASHRLHKLQSETRNTNPISTKKMR
ncbi:hypothetical protein MIMGU_mgv1a0228661mg, partial [Erythranthe guttata]